MTRNNDRNQPNGSQQLKPRQERQMDETMALLPSGGVLGHAPQVKRRR